MRKKTKKRIFLSIILIFLILIALYFTGVFQSVINMSELGQWDKVIIDAPGTIKQGETANMTLILQPSSQFITAGKGYITYYTYAFYIDDNFKGIFSSYINNRAKIDSVILDTTTSASGYKTITYKDERNRTVEYKVYVIGIAGLDNGIHKLTTKVGTSRFDRCDSYGETITAYQTRQSYQNIYYYELYQCMVTEHFFENKVNASLIVDICGLPEIVNGSYYCRGVSGASGCKPPYCCYCSFEEGFINNNISRDYLKEISYELKKESNDYFYVYSGEEPKQRTECNHDIIVNCTTTSSIVALRCVNGTYIPTGYVCSQQNQTQCTQDLTYTCSNGERIIIYKCINGQYVGTNNNCSTGEEINLGEEEEQKQEEKWYTNPFILIAGVAIVMILFIIFIPKLFKKKRR